MVKTWSSLVTLILLAAADAHAASFYGVIRFTNEAIPGSGVSLSTSLVDFFASPGQPDAVVQFAASISSDPGPLAGSGVLVKDFVPGSTVTDFLTFDGWPHHFNGANVSFPPFYLYAPPPWFPPYPTDPGACPNVQPAFCVVDSGGGSTVFFSLFGQPVGQRGYWLGSFGALVFEPADLVKAELDAGQTVVSPLWSADLLAAPEPATSATLITSICLLTVARRKWLGNR